MAGLGLSDTSTPWAVTDNGILVLLKPKPAIPALESCHDCMDTGRQMHCTIAGHAAHSAITKQHVQPTWLLPFCPMALRPLNPNNGAHGVLYVKVSHTT